MEIPRLNGQHAHHLLNLLACEIVAGHAC
jgi:hypothetical protein